MAKFLSGKNDKSGRDQGSDNPAGAMKIIDPDDDLEPTEEDVREWLDEMDQEADEYLPRRHQPDRSEPGKAPV